MVEEDFAHDAVPFDQIDQIDDVQVPLEFLPPLVHVEVISSTLDSAETFLRATDEAADAGLDCAHSRVLEHSLVDNQVVYVVQLLSLRLC